MAFWLWNASSLASALVDSALPGSQEEAWLSCTSMSLEPSTLEPIPRTSHTASTNHLMTGPVSLPAI